MCDKFRRVLVAYAKARGLELRGKSTVKTLVIDEDHLVFLNLVNGNVQCSDDKILVEIKSMMSDVMFEGSIYHVRKIILDVLEKLKMFILANGIWVVHQDSVKVLEDNLVGMWDYLKIERFNIIVENAKWRIPTEGILSAKGLATQTAPICRDYNDVVNSKFTEMKKLSTPVSPPVTIPVSNISQEPGWKEIEKKELEDMKRKDEAFEKWSKPLNVGNVPQDHAWQCAKCSKMNAAKKTECKHCGSIRLEKKPKKGGKK